MFTLRPRQRDGESRSLGNGLGRGTEMALVPLVFVGFGWLLDRWFGTSPVFTIVVSFIGITGTFVKIWLGYDSDMRAQEAGRPWSRPTASTVVPVDRPTPLGPDANDGQLGSGS